MSDMALRHAPMMHTYNEDILWIAYLRDCGFRLERTSEPLLHADARPIRLDPINLKKQALGEAFWIMAEEERQFPPSTQAGEAAWAQSIGIVSKTVDALADRIAADCVVDHSNNDSIDPPEASRLLSAVSKWIARSPYSYYTGTVAAFLRSVKDWQRHWNQL